MNRAPIPTPPRCLSIGCFRAKGKAPSSALSARREKAKNSRRIDVPKDHIPASERRGEGAKYFDPDDLNSRDITPVTKLMDEIFAGKK